MNQTFSFQYKINIPGIKYGFFSREGGLSKDNYSSLNCNLSSNDISSLVNKNIQLAMTHLNLKDKKLKIPSQIHSNKIQEVNDKNLSTMIQADGLITTNKSIAIGVLTADCAPIIIFDINKKFICCLHAGWRGCLLNIAQNSINYYSKYCNNLNDIYVIIGPCLAKNNFEVGLEFKKNFITKNHDYSKFFLNKNKIKDLFDMRGLINFQFREIGINNIFNINEDTYKNSKKFFSHRRAVHNNQKTTGRMLNIVSFA